MMKKVFSLLLAVLVMCTFVLTAYAHDVPDLNKSCSIELKISYNEEPVDGGTLTAIKVGEVGEDDGNYFFVRVGDSEKLDDIESADAVSGLLEFYNTNKDSFNFEKETVDIKNGTGKFTDMSAGLYLIIQEQASSGYSKLNPFLVSLPYMENGTYLYDVTAAAKPELERVPETTKPTPPPSGGLPQTGQMNWPVPVLAVGGLVLFAIGWVLRSNRKKEENAQ